MRQRNLVIHKLEGYAGIRLRADKPLTFKSGLNLLVGRNGSGKSNLIRLVQQIANGQGDIKDRIESSFFNEYAKLALEKEESNPSKGFGEIPIVEYSLLGKRRGRLLMSLKGSITEKYVLKNILSDTGGFGGAIEIGGQSAQVRCKQVYNSHNPPKFEMSGYINFNLFSKEQNNPAHAIMEGPMHSVSVLMRERMLDFYEGSEFIQEIRELENSINARFTAFLGNTNKTVKIYYGEIRNSGRISLSLMDNKNFIQSIDMSTGEAALLNLIFFLSTAKDERWDIISFDEPDIHMHDDMIQVLVSELSELSKALPNCIILIASHSTALIEKLAALGENNVNVVSFDSERRIANSQEDIDLINALTRNGVSFSPLMLSKRKNIFIENQLRGDGKIHRDFFLKFFPKNNKPNIVPIGTSGNVQDNGPFIGAFEEILQVGNISSIGIQDGDIWFKALLARYMKSELSLSRFLQILTRQKGAYIKSELRTSSYYFNFWEIENLYLMPEVLECWTDKNLNPLTATAFKSFLTQRRKDITDQYFNTFYKSILKIRPMENAKVIKVRAQVKKRGSEIDQILKNDQTLELRMKKLIDSILEKNLLQWVPGKEIREVIKKAGYRFNDDKFDFENSSLSLKLRRIQYLESKRQLRTN